MVKHYCDKCHEEKEGKDLLKVKLTIGNTEMYSYGDQANLEVCIDCLNKMGVKSKEYGHATIESKRDTDKLYELIQNIVSDCIANQ